MFMPSTYIGWIWYKKLFLIFWWFFFHFAGRVACGMGTNELIISELVFRNVFTDKTPAEIAALLSCFVFQARTQVENQLTDKLAEGVKAIEQIDAELTAIESKYLVSLCDSSYS